MPNSADVVSIKRLRDFTEDEFVARYKCDRFTAGVLSVKFAYIVRNMVDLVVRGSRSPAVRNSTDLSATLQGPGAIGYPMAAAAQTIPLFMGSMHDGVRIALEEYGLDRLEPGDVIVVNDFQKVGTNLNDACFLCPLFTATGDTFLGSVNIRAPLLDIGGPVAGGFHAGKRNTHEDGLVLPPTLLFDGGKPVNSVFELINDNSRCGSVVIPDIYNINSALRLGERLVHEAVARYGIEGYFGALRYICDAGEESMGVGLDRVPNGTYEAAEYLDSDLLDDTEEYRVQLKIKKRGRRIEFDLSDSSHAARSALNCSWVDVKTATAVALKTLLDPNSPFNSGAMRNIDIVIPPDSFVSANRPHSTMFYWYPLQAIAFAVFRALNHALGPHAVGADSSSSAHFVDGIRPDGSTWSLVATGYADSAWPADKWGDGDSHQMIRLVSVLEAGIEADEADVPHTILTREIIPDTGGPGEHRGGAASMIDSYWPTATNQGVTHLNLKRPPGGGGVYGGKAGTLSGSWILGHRAAIDLAKLPRQLVGPIYRGAKPMTGMINPETGQLDSKGKYHFCSGSLNTPAGAVCRNVTNAAGGWGDPLARDVAKVVVDVRDGYVTLEGAAREYGVVLIGDPVQDPEGLAVDVKATEQLRAVKRFTLAQQSTKIGSRAQWSWVTTSVKKEVCKGYCPKCGADEPRKYPVLSDGGWFFVVKCQNCLHSVSREPWRRLGWVTPEEELA